MIGVGFDFDHTLGVDNGLERRALLALAAELGHPLDPGDAAVQMRLSVLLDDFREGRTSSMQMIAAFAQQLGVASVDPERWRTHCYALVDELVEPLAGAQDILAALRGRGVPLAILTNGWTPLQQKKIARALGADAVDTILVSDVVGIKPQRAAFDALVRALGVPREHAWYVGDNIRGDVCGALAAGLRAVWFDWEGQAYPPDLPAPTLRIGSLRELERLSENENSP
jgi:5'-nucleotidase